MKIVLAGDRVALGSFVANQAAETLRNSLEGGGACNIVVATGSSQFEVLEQLVQQPGIDWSRVHGFHLDEYLGIARTHSASFCGYLASRFVERVPLASFHYLDGTLPAEELKAKADAALKGTRVDLLLCGIGENGHLAFNDPPANLDSTDPYLVVELDKACRKQQVGEGWFDRLADVPKQAISMSIHQILQANQIICTVPDRRKAEAVQKTVEGDITPDVPASVLQNHPNTTLVLDESSSALLSEASLAAGERI